MKDKYKTLVSDIAIFALGNLLIKLIQFFLLPLYTIYMSTAEYGVAELTNNLAELLLPIFSFCIYEATFRYVMDKGISEKSVLYNSLLLLIINSVVFFLFVFVINFELAFEYSFYLFFITMTYALRLNFAGFVRGIGKKKAFVFSGIINVLFLLIFNVWFLAYYNLGIKGYLLSIILSNIVAGLYLIYIVKKQLCYSYKLFDKELLKVMLIFSVPMIFNTLCWWIVNMSNRYIIFFNLGTVEASLYAAASKLPAIINLASVIFQQAWQIAASKEYDDKCSRVFFSNVFKCYSAGILIFGSFVICSSDFLAVLMLKNDFINAKNMLPLLILTAIINCYSIYFGTFYTAFKKNIMVMISTIIGAIINIAISLFFIDSYGVWACVTGSIICYMVIVLMRIYDTNKMINIDKDFKITVPALVIVTTQAVCMTYNKMFLSGFMFLLLLVVFFKGYSIEIKNILRKIKTGGV